ncbi:MAG TPA: DUF397 domain-containing protein, partial [Micromonosporaceae bacterium]|nr:DUF397 domain-containing protein [Micromonosporaceae bacterium]
MWLSRTNSAPNFEQLRTEIDHLGEAAYWGATPADYEECEVNGLITSWKKSSRSGSDNCVEVRLTESGEVQVRDS